VKTNLNCIVGMEKHNPTSVHEAVHLATDRAVNKAVAWALDRALHVALDGPLHRATWRATQDDPAHQSLRDFLFADAKRVRGHVSTRQAYPTTPAE
jgi:hypothetical protein